MALSCLAGAVLAIAASLPAAWWEPLHADENVVLAVAPRSFDAIVDQVFVAKGGAPLHFFIEHATLAWPGGIEGLRLPSLLFLILALPAAGLLARELCGEREAALVVPLVALAPLAVGLATFARMYTLFLAASTWAAWACLRAARTGGTLPWVLAGAALGALVYVHPLAPLYAGIGLAGGMVWSRSPLRRRLREDLPGVAAFALAQLPYFLHALSVNRERYGVVSGARPVRTTHGFSTPESMLHGLTPAGWAGAIVFGALATAGLVWLARERSRSALVLGLWALVPVAFFSLVPAENTRFFDRYTVPMLPAFLLLVVVGALAAARLARSRAALAGAAAVVALAAVEAADDLSRLGDLHRIGLPGLVDAVEAHVDDGVLFASTGRTTYTRQPRLLARHLALELPEIRRVPELDCGEVRAFIEMPSDQRIGLWVFRGRPERHELIAARLGGVGTVRVRRLSHQFTLVESVRPEPPRRLIELGRLVRRAWLLPENGDGGTMQLIRDDGAALEASSRGVPCSSVAPAEPTPYGRPFRPKRRA